MKAKYLILAALALPGLTVADELVVNLASHHINSVFQYNEVNTGLGYRWTHSANNWYLDESEIGVYRNSYYKTNSPYANGSGYSAYIKTSVWKPYTSKYLSINTDIGIAYYGDDGVIPVVPILQVTADMHVTNNITIKLGFTPLPVEVHNIKTDGEVETSTMIGIATLSASYLF